MRIDRLDLTRFGKFTDKALDFGKCSQDQPDLHIVYGPNEAGKSTLMAAYLDLLFGINPKTAYNFKHANNALKIGGVISNGEHAQQYSRLKKTKGSLVDSDDKPVDESVIQQQLAGLGKASYATMFSLDDDTLEQGGESILASKGDLGKLLYSASTGVAGLSEALLLMHEETDGFYKKGKRKFELADLKAQLKIIEAERKQLDTQASGYSKLVKARAEAEALYEELSTHHNKLTVSLSNLQNKKNAFPRLVSLNRLQADLQPLLALPKVSPDWYEQVRALKHGIIKFDTEDAVIAQNIEKYDESIANTRLDSDALGALVRWKNIESTRDQYLIAVNNLPDLQQQLNECGYAIISCLKNLDRTDVTQAESLLLTASVKANITDLMDKRGVLQRQLDVAQKELTTATNLHKECQSRFVGEGGSIDTEASSESIRKGLVQLAELERVIAPYTNNELAAQHSVTEQKLGEQTGLVTKALAKLGPWQGDAQALQSIDVPHQSQWQSLQQKRDLINSRIIQVELSLQSFTDTVEQTGLHKQSLSSAGIVDDVEANRIRRERDAAWVIHRKALDASTADEFERTMRIDDNSQAARLHNTKQVAELAQLQKELFIAKESQALKQKELKKLLTDLDSVKEESARLINEISPKLDSKMSIEAVFDWIEFRAEALQRVDDLTVTERELINIESRISNACKDISECLAKVGTTHQAVSASSGDVAQLVSILDISNAAIKREAVISSFRDQLLSSQQQLDVRNAELENTRQLLEQWTRSWQAICKDCWLGDEGDALSAVVVAEILPQLGILEEQLKIQTILRDKSTHNERIVASFNEPLLALAKDLSIPTDNKQIDLLLQELQVRMEQAVADKDQLKTQENQKSELLAQKASNADSRATSDKALSVMCNHFNVQTIDEVDLKLNDVKTKNHLLQQIADGEQELLELLALTSISEARDIFNSFSADDTQLDIEDNKRQAEDINQQLQQAHTNREHARNAVNNVGGDDAVAVLIEQRANLLLEIEDKSTRYLQQHLALIAADSALKKYRDNHRSSMMKKASDTFSTITLGRYTGLATIQDGALEKLIAIDERGESKNSDELSKGTRFQLYLALRVAGYHEYSRTRTPVPFIADDIMETSDDERSARTFEVLGDMSRVGQVIYLTHHQHLCEIARKVVPGCQIHQL